MMNSAIAAITARENTADLALQALPDAPTVPEPDAAASASGSSAAPLRQRVGLALRRLADRLDAPPTTGAQHPGAAS